MSDPVEKLLEWMTKQPILVSVPKENFDKMPGSVEALWPDEAKTIFDTYRAVLADRDRLRAALQPFADIWVEFAATDQTTTSNTVLHAKAGYFYQAANALTGKEEP